MRYEITKNLNDFVHVKLTVHGLKQLDEYHKQLNLDPKSYRQHHYQTKSRSWTFQLWELMNIFGSKMFNGAQRLFVNNEIKFISDSL